MNSMNMMINSLCDANVSCDTLVVKVAKAADIVCQPIIKEAETNCNDVTILAIICAAIVFVAIIAVCGFLCWKYMEIKAGQREREFQKTKEEEECQRKQNADNKNRENMLDDEKRKRNNAKEDKELERKYALEDEERQRKYYIEDTERARKYAREDKEIKQKSNLQE